jgi:hypothetical protein
MTFDIARIQKRIESMSEGQMLEWLGSAIPGMQRHLEAYQSSRNPDHLSELAIAETTANLVITELMERKFRPVVEEKDDPTPAPSAPSEPPPDITTNSAPRRFLRGRRAKTGTAPAPREDTSD